ncbi:hypothetical protein HZB74_03070 [Candidatus Saccharibacteria bacterium]|nr:hypothetical protein [Candidatus Saccharibacteria bacterium]
MSDSREILSTPNVGDGNTSTLMALERQAVLLGENPLSTYLKTTSVPANIFHRKMTSDPEFTDSYADDSEAKRLSLPAKIYGKLSFAEFALRVSKKGRSGMNQVSRWNAVQEHQLLGANLNVLEILGINDVRLVVPDVHPKDSAVIAARRIPGINISVWNTKAQKELLDQGFDSTLHKPYMLDGFAPDIDAFKGRGRQVVIKSSGSGMPDIWHEKLRETFMGTDTDFALHTQTHHRTQDSITMYHNKESRIEAFYGDLGGQTRLLVGYPSELVGVVCDMRSRGVSVWMATLPPRGSHEKRNLRFAMDNGLVVGELKFDLKRPPTFEDVTSLDINDLPSILCDLAEPPTLPTGIIGTQPFWAE